MKKISILFLVLCLGFCVVGCDNSDRDVTISKASGTYYGQQHVLIDCPDPTAQITYTLDGSDPGQSNYIYDKETGLEISFSSTLRATAGSNVAEATYEIIPYTSDKDATQLEFFNKIRGTWTVDETFQDNFIIDSSTVKFQQTGTPEVKSGYLIKDVNGNTATLLFTNADGNNQDVNITVDPKISLTIDGKVYYPENDF